MSCHDRAPTMKVARGRAVGTAGDDVISGGSAPERIDGRGGHDRICGRGGGDVLEGKAGDDRISGSAGDDRADGGSGRDRFRGGAGDDRARTGRGRDRALGSAGGDDLKGGGGPDRVAGGAAGDRVVGGRGRDTVLGGSARDRLLLNDGERDRAAAGTGPDRVIARDGAADRIDCGPGRDTAAVDGLDRLSNCERVFLGSEDFASPAWSDTGFIDESNWGTIGTGDVDGDGTEELIGRSPFGVETYGWDAEAGRWRALYAGVGPALNDAEGWNELAYSDTIQIVEKDLSESAALIARGAGGLEAWRWDSAGGWTEVEIPGQRPFTDAQGFDQPKNYETIGSLDLGQFGVIYGRDDDVLEIWGLDSNPGNGQFVNFGSIPMPDSNGWDQPSRYRTIQPIDLDGNGRQEIMARDSGGISAWDWQGNQIVSGGPFKDSQGWTDPSRYSTIQPADLDGDGKQEVVARGAGGLEAWDLSSGQQIASGGPFADSGGWNQSAAYYGTIGVADLDGDGRDEVYGRGAGGLAAFGLESGQWVAKTPVFGDWSDADLWDQPRYYGTIQTARIAGGAGDVVIGRDHVGVRALRYSTARGAWTDSAPFPQFSGSEAAAYAAINEEIGAGNGSFDLRAAYPESNSSTLLNYRIDVSNMSVPDGVAQQDWQAVKAQILSELGNAANVAGWYEEYQEPLTNELFTAQGLDTAAEQLNFQEQSTLQLVFDEWQASAGMVNSFAGAFAVIDGPVGAAAVVASSLGGAAISAGLGAPDIQSAINGIEGRYLDIRNRLQSDYTSALSGLELSRQEILGDYGLQTVIGEQIGGDLWTRMGARDRAIFVASGERNFEIESFQSFVPAIWTAFVVDDSYEQAWNTCHQRGLSTANICDIQDGTNNYLMDENAVHGTDCPFTNRNDGPCTPPSADQRAKLFGATADGCVTSTDPNRIPNWDAANCNLGVSPASVYNGAGDWQAVPTWGCTGGDDPFRNNPCGRLR